MSKGRVAFGLDSWLHIACVLVEASVLATPGLVEPVREEAALAPIVLWKCVLAMPVHLLLDARA